MTPPNGDGPPLRFSLSLMGDYIYLQNSGPRPCGDQTCQESTEINAFGFPALSLGMTTTRAPGLLFDARVSAAYHFGAYSQVTENPSGLRLAEHADAEGIFAVTAQAGLGMNIASAAFYIFVRFLFTQSTLFGPLYSFGPGIGVSLGSHRLISLEAAFFPFLKHDGFPDDNGHGVELRLTMDFMGFSNRRRPRLAPESQAPVPQPRSPETIRQEETPQPNQLPPENVRIEGDFIYYVGNINFDFNSAEIRRDDGSYATLDLVSAFLRENPQIRRVEIHGHTDDRGPMSYNALLSMRRALSVRRALIDRGVAGYRVTPAGHGETQPVTENTTDAGRALNRRVEFRIRERTP